MLGCSTNHLVKDIASSMPGQEYYIHWNKLDLVMKEVNLNEKPDLGIW